MVARLFSTGIFLSKIPSNVLGIGCGGGGGGGGGVVVLGL